MNLFMTATFLRNKRRKLQNQKSVLESFGGIVLIGIGAKILIGHLT